MSYNRLPNQSKYAHLDSEIIVLRSSGMSISEIGKRLGMGKSSVDRHLAAMSARGVSPGMTPAKQIDGMGVVKTTIQTNAAGDVINEWRRWVPNAAAMEEVVKGLEERIAGKGKLLNPPKVSDDKLLLELPIPDHHMGMLSWAKETGQDYDCKSATDLLVGGVKSVLAETPHVGRIVMTVLGDYYHSDNRSGMTEKSGHVLDTDSRYAKRLDAGIDAVCQSIELCAAHAKKVEIVIISGNHDWHSAKWLARVLSAYYGKSSRVHVHTDPGPRHYIQHGKVMLAYMHGDTMKAQKFARLIPAEQKRMWADTEYRYGRVGHWHHRSTEEYPGIVVETLPTLAAQDAWAHEAGYLANRAITSFLWHSDYGLRCKSERSPSEIMGP